MANEKDTNKANIETEVLSSVDDAILKPRRVSAKRPGGARMQYSVLTVAGDHSGNVGIGLAKAKEMTSAISKSKSKARKSLISVPITEDGSIPHEIYIKNGASILFLKPAPLGAGIIAGGAIRQILEFAGIKNVSAKVIGTNNQISNAYTLIKALQMLREVEKDKE